MLLLAGSLAAASLQLACHAGAQPGALAPDFQVTTPDGRSLTVRDFRGKVLVLDFWATWCPPCVDETPSLNALQQRIPPSQLAVLGISIDVDGAAYRKFLNDYQVSFATARDPQSAIAHSYHTFKVPETYIINRDGYVARKVVGETDWTSPEMLAYLQDLAAGR